MSKSKIRDRHTALPSIPQTSGSANWQQSKDLSNELGGSLKLLKCMFEYTSISAVATTQRYGALSHATDTTDKC